MPQDTPPKQAAGAQVISLLGAKGAVAEAALPEIPVEALSAAASFAAPQVARIREEAGEVVYKDSLL